MSARVSGPMPAPPQAGAPSAAAPATRIDVIESRVILLVLHDGLLRTLLDDVELDAAVLLAPRIVLVVGDRLVGAEALRDHPLLRDAVALEVLHHGLGALLRQLAVDRGRAGRVGVAL